MHGVIHLFEMGPTDFGIGFKMGDRMKIWIKGREAEQFSCPQEFYFYYVWNFDLVSKIKIEGNWGKLFEEI